MANELTLYNIIPSNKAISRVRERYYKGQKGPESLDALCEYLTKTTTTNIFEVLINELHNVKICCSMLTAAADDAGETTVAVDENGIITGIEDVEIPNLRRYSMMFFPYIFEATKVAYYQSRIGLKYEKDENWLVLPYFVTLYAIEHSEELFDPKCVSAAKSMFIVNLYSSLTEGITNIRDGMKALLNVVLLGEEEEINPVADIIGITKAITLYEMCKETNSFDTILQAVLDNSKSVGQELDYNLPELDIRSQNVKKYCRKFIQENVHHLRDVNEPDEYEPPKFI